MKPVVNILLRSFVGFISVTAAIAIATALFGSFGDFQLKILATTFTISAASVGSLACATFIERQGRTPVGVAGIAFPAVTAALVIFGIWIEIDNEVYWKTTGTTLTIGIALSHALLLFLPQLASRHRVIPPLAAIAITLLALMIIAEIWVTSFDDLEVRIMTALSILIVVLTLTIPILSRITPIESFDSPPTLQLVLTKQPDGLFTDDNGNQYTVRRLD